MSNSRAKAELEAGGPDLERRGRLLGIALFWLLLCYVIGMSSRSILPAVFWPGLAPVANVPDLKRCAREIDKLERQLLSLTGASLKGDGGRLWLSAWDKRALALSGGCGPLERTREDLLELRSRVGSMLEAYEGRPLQLHQRIRRVLDSAAHAPPPQPRPGPE